MQRNYSTKNNLKKIKFEDFYMISRFILKS